MAAAEKLSAIQAAETFFAERKGRGDLDALRFLTRPGGEPPRKDDELPDEAMTRPSSPHETH